MRREAEGDLRFLEMLQKSVHAHSKWGRLSKIRASNEWNLLFRMFEVLTFENKVHQSATDCFSFRLRLVSAVERKNAFEVPISALSLRTEKHR